MVRTRNSSAAAAAAAAAAQAAAEEREMTSRSERAELDELEAAATAAAAAAVAADAAMSVQPLVPVPEDDYGVEAELTNLNWLQSLDITTASGLPTPPCSPAPVIRPPPRQQPKKMTPLQKAQLDLAENAEEYLTDPRKKPPYSYATLICLAMRASNNRITLSNIYAWIRENFMFYKTADPTWQNSIRHNLSLNKCFVKLPRTKGEPGKGGFWKLDLDRLEEGRRGARRRNTNFKRSRNPPKRTVYTVAAETARAEIAISPGSTSASSSPEQEKPSREEMDHVARILGRDGSAGPKCIVLYETPPSSVSPPIPETLTEVPDSTQVSITEEDFTDLLIESAAWDDGVENHLALLDSVLDML